MVPRREAHGLGPPLLWRQAHPCRDLLAVQIVEGDAWLWRFDACGHWRELAVWPSRHYAPRVEFHVVVAHAWALGLAP
jgi:hypothetical protein